MKPYAEGVVYVVDDDESLRASMRWLLESVGLHMEVFASAEEFLNAPPAQGPECLVLDVRMPGMDGLQLQEALSTSGRRIPILFITGHGDVPMAVRAMKSGALDFLEKPFRDQVLLERIQTALSRSREERERERLRTEVHERLGRLTPREREVMEGILRGLPNKGIAAALEVSERTVEIHRGRVMHKLEVRSVAELVRLAVAAGLVESPGGDAHESTARSQD